MTSVEKFKNLLDERYSWPARYTFKFIVPTHKQFLVENLVTEYKVVKKMSRTGKFVSVNATKICESSDEVIATYQKVSVVEGVVSL